MLAKISSRGFLKVLLIKYELNGHACRTPKFIN
jgi:hypothetical protein